MTQVSKILTELQRRGVAVTAEGETLCLKPKDALDEDLLICLREHKPEILDVLSRRPATCGASCYEIQPGRWVHRHGCATEPRPQPSKAIPQTDCKHCEGRGLCNCPACNLRRTEAAVPCVMCQADQRQVWLAADTSGGRLQ
jgi:hypothetical protein